MAELALAASIAGLISLAIQVTGVTQQFVIGVKEAPKTWRDLISELKCLRTVLIDLKDNVVENPEVAEAFEGRASSLLRSLKSDDCSKVERTSSLPTTTIRQRELQDLGQVSTAMATMTVSEGQDPTAGMLALSLQSDPSDGLTLLTQCSHELELLLLKLIKRQEGSSFKVALKTFSWPFAESEVRASLNKIHRYREVLAMSTATDTLVLGAATHNLAKASYREIDNLRTLHGTFTHRVEREKTLSWLSSINFEAKQRGTLEKRHEGTGGKILALESFQEWCTGSGRKLWCHGIRKLAPKSIFAWLIANAHVAGAGKTITASVIIDYLRNTFQNDPMVCVTGIYCNYKELHEQTLVELLANIYFQLVSQDLALPSELLRLYSQCRTHNLRPTKPQITKLLHDRVSGCKKIFLVVDALDELPEVSRRNLITTLEEFQPLPNILVTSRYMENVAFDFKDWNVMEIEASREDIETYVLHRLSEGNRLEKLVKRDQGLKQTIVANVVDKAFGMFLLARLHMDSLATKLTSGEVTKALDILPVELYGTYDEAIQRIDDQGSSARKLGNRVLMWISHTCRPLTIPELQHALAIDAENQVLDLDFMPEEEDLTSVCAGLVLVDNTKTLRLVHYSTHQYLETIRGIRFPSAHVTIAKACLSYMSDDIFKVCLLQSRAEVDARTRQYPFMRYASDFWLNHTLPKEEFLMDDIFRFISHPLFVWNYLSILAISGSRICGAPWSDFLGIKDPETWGTASKIAFAREEGLDKTFHRLLEGTGANRQETTASQVLGQVIIGVRTKLQDNSAIHWGIPRINKQAR